MGKDNTMLYMAAAGGALLLLMNKKSASTPLINTGTGTPKPPVSVPAAPYDPNANIIISKESALTNAQYAAALAANPNIANPYYRLTDAEAQQYLNNYLDLQQGMAEWVRDKHVGAATLLDAAREHWKEFGAVEKRSFLPFYPPSMRPVEHAPAQPANASTKSSGGGFWSSIGKGLGVATSIVGLFGDETLNDPEIEVLVTGSAILSDILPMFPENDQTRAIKARMDGLLKQYV